MFDNTDDDYDKNAHEYMYEVLDRDTFYPDDEAPWSDEDDPDWMD